MESGGGWGDRGFYKEGGRMWQKHNGTRALESMEPLYKICTQIGTLSITDPLCILFPRE